MNCREPPGGRCTSPGGDAPGVPRSVIVIGGGTGVLVAVLVAVSVGVKVKVGGTAVAVSVGTLVSVEVGGTPVAVSVGVKVRVGGRLVAVSVAVSVGTAVLLAVAVAVLVEVGMIGVAVAVPVPTQVTSTELYGVRPRRAIRCAVPVPNEPTVFPVKVTVVHSAAPEEPEGIVTETGLASNVVIVNGAEEVKARNVSVVVG